MIRRELGEGLDSKIQEGVYGKSFDAHFSVRLKVQALE